MTINIRVAVLTLISVAAFASPQADNLAQQGAHAYWNKKYDVAFKNFKKACELGSGEGVRIHGDGIRRGDKRQKRGTKSGRILPKSLQTRLKTEL